MSTIYIFKYFPKKYLLIITFKLLIYLGALKKYLYKTLFPKQTNEPNVKKILIIFSNGIYYYKLYIKSIKFNFIFKKICLKIKKRDLNNIII